MLKVHICNSIKCNNCQLRWAKLIIEWLKSILCGNISESEIWTLLLDEPDDICINENHNQHDPSDATRIHECAAKCAGITNLFAYGTNEFGGQGCQDGLCKCHCIRQKDNTDESCQQLNHKNYWLLSFKLGVNLNQYGKFTSLY